MHTSCKFINKLGRDKECGGRLTHGNDAHLLLIVLAQPRRSRHAGGLLVLLVVLQFQHQVLLALTQLADRLLLDVLIHQVAF